MEIRNSADIVEDSGLGPLIHEMGIAKFFADKSYGNEEIKLFFVVNCVDFAAKNRIRFSKIDSVLYWDVILDYEQIKHASVNGKKKILAKEIIASLDVLDKYKHLKLIKDVLKADATKYFKQLNWISSLSAI